MYIIIIIIKFSVSSGWTVINSKSDISNFGLKMYVCCQCHDINKLWKFLRVHFFVDANFNIVHYILFNLYYTHMHVCARTHTHACVHTHAHIHPPPLNHGMSCTFALMFCMLCIKPEFWTPLKSVMCVMISICKLS